MCIPGQRATAGATGVVAGVRSALERLAGPAGAELTGAERAEVLRGLAQVESALVAARSAVLTRFTAERDFEADGQVGPRSWLAWQARVTPAAAAGATGWARRLAAHPQAAAALAGGQVSVSWARQVCAWSDALPDEHRADADAILLGAAAGGAGLGDLAVLAAEMRARTARPDGEDDGGFADRALRLETTFGGAGALTGQLTPQCAAAVRAVLDALGKKAGPEDDRTRSQREHDALEEACRRLVGAGGLPERAGQPTQIQLHLTLDQLRQMGGCAAGFRPPAQGSEPVPGSAPAWAGGSAAGPGYDCDAQIVPVVAGTVDHSLVGQAAADVLGRADRSASPADPARRARAERAARDIVVRRAADLLSGPGGLAARLRAGLLSGPAASPSLPLDIGQATDTVPAHLRRAVAARDRRCRFPGCALPVAACQPHHVVPRSRGGPTALHNLLCLCAFHHLIAVHRWGWQLTLHADGALTAVSPDGRRTLRDHAPPPAVAA